MQNALLNQRLDRLKVIQSHAREGIHVTNGFICVQSPERGSFMIGKGYREWEEVGKKMRVSKTQIVKVNPTTNPPEATSSVWSHLPKTGSFGADNFRFRQSFPRVQHPPNLFRIESCGKVRPRSRILGFTILYRSNTSFLVSTNSLAGPFMTSVFNFAGSSPRALKRHPGVAKTVND